MKNFKIFLILVTIFLSCFKTTFAIEQKPQNLNNFEEETNNNASNFKTIFIEKNEIKNFEFTNSEKETIKQTFNLDDANLWGVLNLIKLEIKKFLTEKLKFNSEKEIENFSVNFSISKNFIIDSKYRPCLNSFFYLHFKIIKLNNSIFFSTTIANPLMITLKDIQLEKRQIIKI